jgi:hypothetical protein
MGGARTCACPRNADQEEPAFRRGRARRQWRAGHRSAELEPRKVFVVDNGDEDLPLDALVGEVRAGLDATLREHAKARDPAYLSEVESRLQRLN